MRATYLDGNATTPVDPRVAELVSRYMTEEFGNSGSRTHSWGLVAARAVEEARRGIGLAVEASPDEIIFTSGATEANNLAILGLAEYGKSHRRLHLITTAIEHKAVLEPLKHLTDTGPFELTILEVDERGWPTADALSNALRPDTLLVSTMHINNETGVVLPIEDYGAVLEGHPAFWHVDAAQSFGKYSEPLRNRRIDLISVSAHKVFGPKGVGALISRRRKYQRPPLTPLMFGGGQERGLRPGTLPVALVAGFGEAARLATTEISSRRQFDRAFRAEVLKALDPLRPLHNGDPTRTADHVLNVTFPGIDAEAAMVMTKDLVAMSNGSACTSSSYEPSHVLVAMGLDESRISGALRLSWNYMTPSVPWGELISRLQSLRS